MSFTKMTGQLTNNRTLTSVVYANQNTALATDANDTEILYYSNGAPTSSSALSFNSATNELNVVGSIVGATATIAGASILNLLIGNSFNLPSSLVIAYPPTPGAAAGYTATAGFTGYTMDLGGIKFSWGSQQFNNVSGSTVAALQTINSIGGIFTAIPTLTYSISAVGVDTDQNLTGNFVALDSFNFFNNATAVGGTFIVSWVAIGM